MTSQRSAPTVFITASVAFVDDDGRLLMVRKRGTSRFMLPGGKLEPGETPLQAALREVREEVDVALTPDDVTVLGHWRAAAANEPDALVDSVVHVCRQPADAMAAGEIEEVRWVSISAPELAADLLAPLLTAHVLPALRLAGTT